MSAKSCASECAENLRALPPNTAFGCPRNFLDNRFVYVVVSARARGLSIGINMTPDKHCNFECIYCEVDHNTIPAEKELDISVMASELDKTLLWIRSGIIHSFPPYHALNEKLLQLRHVAFSGDGEPTLCPTFEDAVEAVVHVRARNPRSFFKLVLITNGTGLHLPAVQEGLKYFVREDEIWIKLDAGTQGFMDKVNRSEVPLQTVLDNALAVGRQRPIIIQSLFPLVDGKEPPEEEIDQYVARLKELKDGGAHISLVQIYSATRPTPNSHCGHLSLRSLSRIGHRIKAESGLNAEVF